MYKLLLFSCLSAFAADLSAQITLSADYFPAAGDELVTSTSVNPGATIVAGPAGTDLFWDFSSLAGNAVQTQTFFTAASGDQFVAFGDTEVRSESAVGAQNYYDVTSAAFSLVGFAGNDPLGQGLEVVARYQPPAVERWAPLAFGDEHTTESALRFAFAAADVPGGLLDSIPFEFDSLRISIQTERTDVVDAWGTMTIPLGTYNVLRERRTQMRDVRLEIKTLFFWFDITDVVIALLSIPELGANTTVSYYYWSDTAKEPIAVVTTTEEDPTPLAVTYKSDGISGGPGVPALQPSINVFPNPVSTTVTLALHDLPLDRYRVEVLNLLGQPMWQESYQLSGDYTTTLDVRSLQNGVYFCRFTNGAGKVLATQRLLVVHP